jgi:hypothetical protein
MAKIGRRRDMGSVMERFPETHLVVTLLMAMVLVCAAAQIADAPPLEALNPDDLSCYRIDDDGRIIDSNGRLRGWIKGDEIYGPALQLKYRLSGRRLQDAP